MRTQHTHTHITHTILLSTQISPALHTAHTLAQMQHTLSPLRAGICMSGTWRKTGACGTPKGQGSGHPPTLSWAPLPRDTTEACSVPVSQMWGCWQWLLPHIPPLGVSTLRCLLPPSWQGAGEAGPHLPPVAAISHPCTGLSSFPVSVSPPLETTPKTHVPHPHPQVRV